MKHRSVLGLGISVMLMLWLTACASSQPLTSDGFDKASVGSTVLFGKYEQDNVLSNGEEDIEWIVLDKKEDRLLVVSKYALECRQVHFESKTYVDWESCDLREWLNTSFYEHALSKDEQKMVLLTNVTADKNPEYDTYPDSGNVTRDKVYLLSTSEMDKYFGSAKQKRCKATDYCIAQGAYGDQKGYCMWWLRTPGIAKGVFVTVLENGAINYRGWFASTKIEYAVRPAMWIIIIQ